MKLLLVCVTGLLLSLPSVYSQAVTVGVTQTALSVSEGDGSVRVCMRILSGSAAGRFFLIGFTTIGSSAVAGSDFTQETGTRTLSQSSVEECVDVPIIDDSIAEPDETFNFQIFDPISNSAVTINPALAVITITDSSSTTETIIGFQFSTYSVDEGSDILVCVEVNRQLTSDITFQYATSDGTAVANLDYTPVTTTLSFGPLNDDQLICMTIVALSDNLFEGPETLTVRLSATESVVTFNPGTATVTIGDDDPNPCNSDPCDVNAACTPTIGATNTFTCVCNSGFMGNGFTCMAMGGGDDPHFSIVLPSGKLLCFTVQGERDFAFNLISTDRVHINALFVADSVREEVTWMGALGIVVQGEKYHGENKTSLRFDAKTKTVSVGNKLTLDAKGVESLKFSNGKLIISEKDVDDKEYDHEHPSVCVNLEDVGLHFHVTFYGEHLDIFWNSVTIDNEGNKNIHGLIGQFYREGVKIDTVRKLLLLPTMEPVPVMRRPMWGFMEREVADDELCWTAMNQGYQGKGLIEGVPFDYLVNDVLDDGFNYGKKL